MATKTSGKLLASTQSMQDLLSQYGAREEQESRRRAALREEGLQALATILSSNPEYKRLYLSGYTSGFNDGDPCVHKQGDVSINGYSLYGDEDNFEGEEKLAEPSKEDLTRINNLVRKMKPIFSGGFGTNWEITIKREQDDSLSWALNPDFDCGY